MTTPSRRSPAPVRCTAGSGSATTSRSRTARVPRRSSARPRAARSCRAGGPDLVYTLTVRHGPRVERSRFEGLDEAIAALKRRGEEIRAEGGLGEVTVLRTYEPQDRVHARLEVTGPGLLRRPEAGVDIMGDGALVPYRGALLRKRLDPRGGQSAYDAVREALEAKSP